MNVAEYLINELAKLGITDIFGVPGDYSFSILNIIESRADINWVGCTNELNAGYAADGYAREKGYGALLTTYGVGELSAINAISGSMAENVPVINIVGAPSTTVLNDNKPFHHNFQNPKPYAFFEAYKNVTEAAAFLNRDNAKIEIDRLLKIFINEKKPVYIAIPSDIAVMDIKNKEVEYEKRSDADTLKMVSNLIISKIKEAQKPVIIADMLVERFNAKFDFNEFLKSSGIPASNLLMGVGVINSDYEKYLGTYYSKYDNEITNKYITESDCPIFAGVTYGDINSCWDEPDFDINSKIAIYGNYTYVDGILYEDVKMNDLFLHLAKDIEHRNFETEKHILCYKKSEITEGKLSSKYFYERLQEYISENDLIYSDIGSHTLGISKLKLPSGAKLNTQNLWASTGWATPAAFGASKASPDKNIILITGEGAHQSTAMEIGSFLRFGLKPVVIVINNGGYSLERLLSDNPNATYNDTVKIDYPKLARSFEGEVWGTTVQSADDFDKALRVTKIMKKLCYIEVILDKDDVSELTKNMFIDSKTADKKKKVKTSQINKNNKTVEKTEKDIKLNLAENINYSTLTHKSLKEIEDSGEA